MFLNCQPTQIHSRSWNSDRIEYLVNGLNWNILPSTTQILKTKFHKDFYLTYNHNHSLSQALTKGTPTGWISWLVQELNISFPHLTNKSFFYLNVTTGWMWTIVQLPSILTAFPLTPAWHILQMKCLTQSEEAWMIALLRATKPNLLSIYWSEAGEELQYSAHLLKEVTELFL